MITTGTTININSLRYIINFVETHGYLICSQAELFGAGCTDCLYHILDHILGCYIIDDLPTLIR